MNVDGTSEDSDDDGEGERRSGSLDIHTLKVKGTEFNDILTSGVREENL